MSTPLRPVHNGTAHAHAHAPDNDKPLWTPSNPETSRAFRLRDSINATHNTHLSSYFDLYKWSVSHPAEFWSAIWDETGVIGEKGSHVVDSAALPPDNPLWFNEASMNWAENMLRCRSTVRTALISTTESVPGCPSALRRISYHDLYQLVADVVSALLLVPVSPGDRIASYSPNCIENVACCLAATALGCIWISAAADFGPDGVLERFQQVQPRVVFSGDAAVYNAKIHPHLPKLSKLLDGLRARGIEPVKVVVIPTAGTGSHRAQPQSQSRAQWEDGWTAWEDFVAEGAECKLGRDAEGEILWRRGGFNWPLWILFSSGTTGLPKPIVHRAGGMLLQSNKEHMICADITASDVFFYYTSCGWMMYNYLISALAVGCTLVLYDGSPLYDKSSLWNLVDELGVTVFGASAKYLDSLSRVYRPRKYHDLSTLKHIYSTGSPLPGSLYDFVYEHISPNVLLASITGGTDICSLFAGMCSALPVFRGEIQCRLLGMAVEGYSQQGEPVPPGQAGELVCTKPFPCQPVGFWPLPGFGKDEAVETAQKRYKQSYFETFKDVWYHGDHVIITKSREENGGGLVMLGRSDGVLNPGGVRFGSSEIYEVLEQYFSESSPSISASHVVHDALAVGQAIQDGADERVILFVKLGEGEKLSPELDGAIRAQIRVCRSARHVPEQIIQVSDVPYTINGKRVEVPVKKIINGTSVTSVNPATLRNPECLSLYEKIGRDLRTQLP